MKKMLSVLGVTLIFGSSSFATTSNLSKKKNAPIDITQYNCSLASMKKDNKQNCNKDDSLISKYKITTNNQGQTVKSLYVDQWLVNAHYDWFSSDTAGQYGYDEVLQFLEGTISGFKQETDPKVKELITKSFMTHSVNYANKSISGMFVTVIGDHFGYTVQYGIFDTWERYPLEQDPPNRPADEFVNWDDQFVNETVRRNAYIMPLYNRYGEIEAFRKDFDYFNFPEATIEYYFKSSSYNEKMKLEWKDDIFSTNLLQKNQQMVFKNENFSVRNGRYNQIDITAEYSMLVDYDTIRMPIKFKAKGNAKKNSDYGVAWRMGNYFNVFNYRSDVDTLQDYIKFETELNNKQLPPTGPTNARPHFDFVLTTIEDWTLNLKLNHALLTVFNELINNMPNISNRQMFDGVLSKLFVSYFASGKEEKELILTIIDNIISHSYPEEGMKGLINAFLPWMCSSNYGVQIQAEHSGTMVDYIISPWNAVS